MKKKNEFKKLEEEFDRHLIANDFTAETRETKQCTLKYFFNFLIERKIYCIRKISREIITEYQVYLWNTKDKKNRKLRETNISRRLLTVKQFFEWLVKTGRIIYDLAKDIEMPKQIVGLPKTILSQKEIEKVLLLPDTRLPIGYRDRTIMELLYSTGIRNSELRNLKITDYNPEDQTIIIRQGKGRKDRLIPLTGTAAGYLKEYLAKVRIRFIRKDKKEDRIFLNREKKSLRLSILCKIIAKYKAISGIAKPFTPHVFRYSIATHLLENGMPIRYIQEFLGHECINSTQRYAQVTLSDLRKVYNKYHPKEQRNHPAIE